MALKLEDIQAANMYAADIKGLVGVRLKWTEILKLAHLQKEHNMEAMFMVLKDHYGIDAFALKNSNGQSLLGDPALIKYHQRYSPMWRQETELV
ncbi:hypothetical protein HOG16_02450 [Candidatus Woesearchaeota archaeon]|jgi:hypothetical protein|nr:hypothetical protein [Candidatus Woesearchaeota archaeon]MBT4321957.1 hypothetical protein [Candidatus Woesearchaeota archaeon]MBT4631309.1 hypothetical protein [Candidatus Woesearchaeota archaeon]